MFQVQHLVAGARRYGSLVQDDVDIVRLLDGLHDRFGESLLAYCVMRTHVHAVVEGKADANAALFAAGVRAYGQAFLRRHKAEGPLLRGPVHVTEVPGGFELARTIHYVHDNPVGVITPKALLYEWASTRAFVGLARTPYPNVARALALIGEEGKSLVVPSYPTLADLEPTADEGQPLGLIVAACARVYGVLADEIVHGGRAPRVKQARATVVALGLIEGHPVRTIAAALGVTGPRVYQLRAVGCDREGARAARTLIRSPAHRERLTSRSALDIHDQAVSTSDFV